MSSEWGVVTALRSEVVDVVFRGEALRGRITPLTRDNASYQGALGHYLSPRRRDPVKTLMEEVVSHKIFASAVRRLRLPAGRPLRVLDIGSGVGDGFDLLTETHGDLAPVRVGTVMRAPPRPPGSRSHRWPSRGMAKHRAARGYTGGCGQRSAAQHPQPG
jgi:hypothetical protein